jgi:hypothetical protein
MIALRQQAKHRFLLACTLCLASIGVNATEDGCAVVLKAPDGFLALREGPGIDFPVIAKLSPGTFLYIDTRSYYEIGKRTGFADPKKLDDCFSNKITRRRRVGKYQIYPIL